jgi:hypothetical protein
MKKRKAHQNIDYHTPVLRFFWAFWATTLATGALQPVSHGSLRRDSPVQGYQSFPTIKYPRKPVTLKGHTVYLLSHELLWCGNTTATATLPKSSALWVLCRKHPHWVSHIVSICIDNDGPKSWTLQLDGRLVPRLGSDKVFYCSSTYVVDSNVFFRVVSGWWFQLCCTFQP